jgi:hypothetical protein
MADRVRAGLRAAAVCAVAFMGAGGLAGVGAARAAPASTGSSQTPAQLTVDDQAQPLDVAGAPQFGWIPRDRAGNEIQTAYEIVVRNALTGVPVWDSGRVSSPASSYVAYAGPQLTGGAEYGWTVVT